MIPPTLQLHVPRRSEFHIRREWLRNPEMMSYNAGWELPTPFYDNGTGCIDWTESQWDAFEARLQRPSHEQGYYFVAEGSEYVGHAHYEVDSERRAHIGINVIPQRRGEGLSLEMLRLLLERVWSNTDAVEAVNDFEDGRAAAAACHRRAGFTPDTALQDDGPKPTRVWRLKRPSTAG